jgi:hypothetical protein
VIEQLVTLQEHSEIAAPVVRLGYEDAARRALGSRADSRDVHARAVDKFRRRNQDRLSFLDITLTEDRLASRGKAGAVPLVPAASTDSSSTLVVQPMSPWTIFSQVVEKTPLREWLNTKQDWRIGRHLLDLDLWYFATPFVAEAKKVLRRPGRAFVWRTRTEQAPRGATNWNDYAVRRAPYAKVEFSSSVPAITIDAIPHRLMKWGVSAIADSIRDWSSVPPALSNDLNWLQACLAGVESVVPDDVVLRQLPRTGAWTGYGNVYAEMENLAALSGVLVRDRAMGCAFSIDAERLFEILVCVLASEWASANGYASLRDLDDSSRISLVPRFHNNAQMLKSLRPDIVLLSDNTAVIVDAKYKRHYDGLIGSAADVKESNWYEDFRHDVHQVMSYGAGYRRDRVLFLLSHPTALKDGTHINGGLRLWRVGGTADSFIGFLPVCLHAATTLADIGQLFWRGLSRACAMEAGSQPSRIHAV